MGGRVPPEIEAFYILRRRAPKLDWSLERVVMAAQDFAELDVVAVAQQTADFILTRGRVKDGPKLFRTFLENERARRDRDQTPEAERRLSAYDRRANR